MNKSRKNASHRTIFVLIALTVILLAYLIIGPNSNLDVVVAAVAVITGAASVYFSLGSDHRSGLDAVKEYFQQGDQEDLQNARKFILDSSDELIESYASEIKSGYPHKDSHEFDKVIGVSKKTVNFWHLWGLMEYEEYLPSWVFEGASGIQLVKAFVKLYPVITARRKTNEKGDNNIYYADGFDYLARKVYRRLDETGELENATGKLFINQPQNSSITLAKQWLESKEYPIKPIQSMKKKDKEKIYKYYNPEASTESEKHG